MKPYLRTLILALPLLFGIACSSGASDPDMKQAMEAKLTSKHFGTIVEITKLNGQAIEFMGTKVHAYYVRIVTKLGGPGWYWFSVNREGTVDPHGGYKKLLFDPKNQSDPSGPQTPPIIVAVPVGTIFVMTGEIHFRMTDNGWVEDSWLRLQHGTCPTASELVNHNNPSKRSPLPVRSTHDCVKDLKLEDQAWRPSF